MFRHFFLHFIAHFTRGEIVGISALFVCLALAWRWPLLGAGVFGWVETWGKRLAGRRGLALVTIAAATIGIRLALLWVLPIPVPKIHDEFSYLLAGDTFAHGRLTNPTHPMWLFFDTFHVNQHPTYMSKYPPGQGAALALGQLLGHPWIGVLLSAAGMCAAVLWMMQGWLPPEWALLGATLVLLRLGTFSYWINSYWGGAVAAIGGALVMGAMPRIMHFHRSRDAVLLGIGAAILLNSRPLEGFIFCVPVAVALLAWLSGRRSPSWRITLPRVVAPFCVVALLCGIFVGYYNWRGTGKATVFPYVVNDQTYFSTPAVVWQKERPKIHYANPQFDAFYNKWVPDLWRTGPITVLRTGKYSASTLAKVGYMFMWPDLSFFIWPELCVLVVALPYLLLNRRTRFFLVQTIVCFLGLLLVSWAQPHYIAALTATLFALLTQGMRHLRRWTYQGRPVGLGLTRVVVLFTVLLAPLHPQGEPLGHPPLSGIEYRAQFASQLEKTPGKHLVIVRYSPGHNVLEEWVYNKAEIDRAKVVWAREMPGVDIEPLLHYFRGRQVWLAEPDAPDAPHLGAYHGAGLYSSN